MDQETLLNVGSVVSGDIPTQAGPQSITLYRDARGGAGDSAIMKLAYERAKERGLGTEVDL